MFILKRGGGLNDMPSLSSGIWISGPQLVALFARGLGGVALIPKCVTRGGLCELMLFQVHSLCFVSGFWDVECPLLLWLPCLPPVATPALSLPILPSWNGESQMNPSFSKLPWSRRLSWEQKSNKCTEPFSPEAKSSGYLCHYQPELSK